MRKSLAELSMIETQAKAADEDLRQKTIAFNVLKIEAYYNSLRLEYERLKAVDANLAMTRKHELEMHRISVLRELAQIEGIRLQAIEQVDKDRADQLANELIQSTNQKLIQLASDVDTCRVNSKF